MVEILSLVSERVDDTPVLLAHLERMGLQLLLDGHFPTHGHGVGLSLGWVSVVWLTHMLSEGDHRLHHVAPWATQRLHTLQECTGQPVHPLDVSDDRLATVLAALRVETHGQAFEGALHQHTLRVHDLGAACVRLDSITAHGHWRVTEDGLCQFGPSTDHRPDLPQVKIMISALDQLGMPVATDVVPGQRAEAPRSLPAITRGRDGLRRSGRLDWGRWSEGGPGDAGLPPGGRRHLLVSGAGDPTLLSSLGRRPGARVEGGASLAPAPPRTTGKHLQADRRRV